MIGFLALVGAWLAMVVKELVARAALLAVVIGVVTGVIIATKLGMEALVALVPSVPLSPNVLSALGALLPSNFRTCIELLIEARLALLLFTSKWLYLRMYMWAMQWKFI